LGDGMPHRALGTESELATIDLDHLVDRIGQRDWPSQRPRLAHAWRVWRYLEGSHAVTTTVPCMKG
jgi:hypothetical protein